MSKGHVHMSKCIDHMSKGDDDHMSKVVITCQMLCCRVTEYMHDSSVHEWFLKNE